MTVPDRSKVDQFKQLIEMEPNDPVLHYGLGMEYQRLGDFVAAAEEFRRTTEVVLTHHKTRQSTKARIVRTDSSNGDKIQLIAVELDVPSETFWGITF